MNQIIDSIEFILDCYRELTKELLNQIRKDGSSPETTGKFIIYGNYMSIISQLEDYYFLLQDLDNALLMGKRKSAFEVINKIRDLFVIRDNNTLPITPEVELDILNLPTTMHKYNQTISHGLYDRDTLNDTKHCHRFLAEIKDLYIRITQNLDSILNQDENVLEIF